MRVAWIDCSAGASGDMLLGALLDASADTDLIGAVNAAVRAVDSSLAVGVARTSRHQIAAAEATVTVDGGPDGGAHGRSWAEVRRLIEAAVLGDSVRSRALDAFARLARAEAAAHGAEPDDVHFHEVGALDAIADIVGVSAAVAALDLDRIVVSPVVLGGGPQVHGQHGGIPVPGPAVLSLLAEAGAPVSGGAAPYEMTTPTGAALLATLADEFGSMPPMRIERTGVGAGGRDPVEVPNLLRVVIGEAVAEPVSEMIYETNVDDMDPRIWPQVLSRLLEAGAADAWLTPILMKKGRPAHTLSVLVSSAHAEAVRHVILTETSAIGLRESPVLKHTADRTFASVDVAGQRIRVKVAWYGGQVVNVQPEYDDVVAAATALNRPVKSVLAAAIAAGHQLWS